MAISFVQQASAHGSGGTVSITVPSTTAGNLLVVFFICEASFATYVEQITDNVGGVYAQCENAYSSFLSGNPDPMDTWYARNINGGNVTLTVNVYGPYGFWEVDVLEFSGADINNPFVNANNLTQTASPIGPTLTPTFANGVLVAAISNLDFSATGFSAPYNSFASPNGTTYGYYLNPPLSPTFASEIPTTSQPYESSAAFFRESFTPSPTTPIALIQSESGGFLYGSTVAIPIFPSGSGNLMVVSVTSNNELTSITDNAGNTYVQAVSGISPNLGAIALWYAENSIAGSTLVTVTFSGPIEGVVQVAEYSGVATVSPIDTSNTNYDSSGLNGPVGPSLTIINTNDLLLSLVQSNIPVTGVDTPWILLPQIYQGAIPVTRIAQLLNPGTIGSYNATFVPSTPAQFGGVGLALFPFGPHPLTLSLSDSVVVSDFPLAVTIFQNLSDTVVVSDSVPGSFSVQSDFLAPVTIPVVEQLVNQLVPANVKTYFKIVE